MTPNPFLGVFFHWLGGLASGSFYVPYRAVRHWAWETYWLAGGVFSWIVAPWLIGTVMTDGRLLGILSQADARTLFWTYFFGVMWGLGGLTFGLTMRYLGMSLGMAVALGYCAAFGTLMPPIFSGEFFTEVLQTTSGRVVLAGVAVCLVGIAVAGIAGMSKEGEMSEEDKKRSIKEFSFKKGILVATFSGVMSASFSYGLKAGDPIKEIATGQFQVDPLWQGLPVLVVVLLGGFTTNFLWCLMLHFRNGTAYQYLSPRQGQESLSRRQETILETATDAAGEEMAEAAVLGSAQHRGRGDDRVPLLWNYFFCALAGITWYFQFFFYTMGESQMGAYGFSSWTLHMASIIIFSSIWGIALREWRGTSSRTRGFLAAGLALLILSTVIVGYGNYLTTATAG